MNKAMTTLLLNVLNDDPECYELRMEALKAMELVLKEAGGFPNEIRAFMDSLELPPEPPDPKVLAELQRQKELEEIRKWDEEEEKRKRKLKTWWNPDDDEECQNQRQMKKHCQNIYFITYLDTSKMT